MMYMHKTWLQQSSVAIKDVIKSKVGRQYEKLTFFSGHMTQQFWLTSLSGLLLAVFFRPLHDLHNSINLATAVLGR